MVGKWNSLRKKLKKLPLDRDFKTKVDEEKLRILGMPKKNRSPEGDFANNVRLARLFVNAKLEKQEISNLNVTLEALSQLIADSLEGEEVEKVELVDGVTITLHSEPYCSVKDRSKLFAWIKKYRRVELVGVAWATLNSMVKGNIESGIKDAVPPGVEVFLKTGVRVIGLRNKEEKKR
jgi:hypothetical protein